MANCLVEVRVLLLQRFTPRKFGAYGVFLFFTVCFPFSWSTALNTFSQRISMSFEQTAYYIEIKTRLSKLIKENPSILFSTQSQVSIPVIERIAKKLKAGLFTAHISVKDGGICEGHHRYLASMLAGVFTRRNPGEFPHDLMSTFLIH